MVIDHSPALGSMIDAAYRPGLAAWRHGSGRAETSGGRLDAATQKLERGVAVLPHHVRRVDPRSGLDEIGLPEAVTELRRIQVTRIIRRSVTLTVVPPTSQNGKT